MSRHFPLRSTVALLALCLAALSACDGEATTTSAPPTHPNTSAEELVGPTTRNAILRAERRFAPERAADVDVEAVAALRHVPRGASITVVLGVWCDDSQREVSRWFRALDELGSRPPFLVEYIAVGFRELAQGIAPLRIEYVPTFIVNRGGDEVGRVVETSPNGIERDVLRLLSGEARGVVTDSGH